MTKLVEIMLAANFAAKPTVEALERLDGIDKVSAAERDEAWKEVQAKKKAAAAEEKKKVAEAEANKNKPTHTVTVKKDGFRRCGRAWSGSEDVKLTKDEVKVLDADPMFVVVKL